MIDPELERRTADCTELMDAWRQFLDMANRALKPPKTTTPQLEQQFLMNKARIAMLHDAFMTSLKHDRQVGQNMIEIVNRAITLRGLTKITDAEIKKIELEWHECFLLLNETVTSLNEDRERLAAINEFSHNMKKMREGFFLNVRTTLGSFYFKIVAIPTVLVLILWGIQALGIYNYDNIRRIGFLRTSVYTTYHQVKRGMGFDGKYVDMTQSKESLPSEAGKVPTISALEMVSQKTPADKAIQQFAFLDAGTKEILETKRSGYELYNYRTQGDKKTAFLFVFLFDEVKNAKAVENFAKTNQARLTTQHQIHRKANAIFILKCDDQTLSETIVNEVIKKVKP